MYSTRTLAVCVCTQKQVHMTIFPLYFFFFLSLFCGIHDIIIGQLKTVGCVSQVREVKLSERNEGGVGLY